MVSVDHEKVKSNFLILFIYFISFYFFTITKKIAIKEGFQLEGFKKTCAE